jgi:hypothetical protein
MPSTSEIVRRLEGNADVGLRRCMGSQAPPGSVLGVKAVSGREKESLERALLGNGFNPEAQGKVFALGVAQLPAQLALIALSQYLKIEGNGLRQILYVVAIPLEIAFQFR